MASISLLATSFARSQKAEGRSPHTIKLYRDCINRIVTFAGDDLSNVTRRTLTDFYAIRSETVAPATVWTDFKVHRVFLKWLVDEEELPSSPMDRMRQPRQPIVPVPTLNSEQVAQLIAACSGRTTRDRRDTAMIRLAIDSGCRRGELAALKAEEVKLDDGVALVTGKGRTRLVPFGSATAIALDRWMRQSGVNGCSLFGLTASGISQAFKARARTAGLPDAHLHMTRHTFAHRWLAASGSETDLMTIAGWSPGSRSMLDRYGASARVERALAAHRRLGLGDNF